MVVQGLEVAGGELGSHQEVREPDKQPEEVDGPVHLGGETPLQLSLCVDWDPTLLLCGGFF